MYKFKFCIIRHIIALWRALKSCFLLRVGSRHHNWGPIAMFIPLIELHLNALLISILFAWSLWTHDTAPVISVLIVQTLVFITSFILSYRMSEEGVLLLFANFFPCTVSDVARCVKLTAAEMTYWPYRRSAGIRDEFTLEQEIIERILELRDETRESETLPHYIWDDRSDRVMRDILDILEVLLGDETFDESHGLRVTRPMKYSKENLVDPRRAFRLEHPFKKREDIAISTMRYTSTSMRYPHDYKGWISEDDLDEISIYSEDLRDRMFLNGPEGAKSTSYPPSNYPPDPSDFQSPSERWRELTPAPRSMEEAIAATALSRSNQSQHKFRQLPRIEEWERFSSNPPVFLYNIDDNKYLGPVRAPNLVEVQRVQRELGESLTILQPFLGTSDQLLLQRRQEHILDIGAVDFGHIPECELKRRLHILNTIDYVPLFHHFPSIRRFTTRCFMSGCVSPMEYGLVVVAFEIIAFVCTMFPWAINSFEDYRLHFDVARTYNHAFVHMTARSAPSVSILIGVAESFVLNRLLIELIRPAGIHVILSVHSYYMGNMFSWKNIAPYIVGNIATAMRKLSNVRYCSMMLHKLIEILIRRIACRRYDNLVEVSNHQLDPLLFIILCKFV